MSDESIQVSLDALDQFAAGVAGSMAMVGRDGGGGGSGLADDYGPDGGAAQMSQEFNGALELVDPFSGGGLQEGLAFARVHQAYTVALGQFLGEVGLGLTTLGQGAAAIRNEYAYGDADSAAVTDSVYQLLVAPTLERTAQGDRDARQGVWNDFVEANADHGLFGNFAIYVAGGGPADVTLGRNIQALKAAQQAQQDAQDSAEHGDAFEAQVQEARERLEAGGSVTEEGGRGAGDLGRGTTATPIMDGAGRIPADNERVADTPPQSVTGDVPSPGA